MVYEWCVEDKQTLVTQNVLKSNRFIDGCNSYKNRVDFTVKIVKIKDG